ncbi:hypothetical protein [Ligilactobacillus pabuli]|uniref:hypothetical protein n=1 Tax=Ligilactobacillus pabuli TaxID=2886039 RepID=UPI001FB960D5|nr:hypothetical protein [Ligilactobacillus pabuli]
MVDWKFGSYKLIWWLIAMVMCLPANFISGWFQLIVLVIILLVLFSATFLFEKKKPQLKEKNRQTTISYFRGICFLLMVIIYFAVTQSITDFYNLQFSGMFPLLCLALLDILPSFFTKTIPNEY